MKKRIQKILGIDVLIKEQIKTNQILSELLHETKKYNRKYNID